MLEPAGGLSPRVIAAAVLALEARAAAASLADLVRAESPAARVVTAVDRASFLAALHEGSWSLVIVSFGLPDYPGTAALHEALQRSSAPCIAVGAAPVPAEIAAALRAGAEDFVDRAEGQVLAARVAKHLRSPAGSGAAGAAPATADAMLFLDEDWRVVDASDGVAAVLGFQPGELAGRSLASLLADPQGAQDCLQRLRACMLSGVASDSAWMLRRDGLHAWAELTCVTDVGAGHRPREFRLTLRDATLQYRATQSVRHQADAAVTAAAGRNLFLGSIAHELRGALAPILTSAIVLERRAEAAEQPDRLVGIIRRNAASASRLVEDLLTFSTVSENKLLMRQDDTDLRQLVAECADAAQHHASAARVSLEVEPAPAPGDARVRCDADRIRQVVANLIGNALKFTPAGGTVRVRACATAEAVDIEVADDGAGIDPEVLPFIFEPFEQGGSEITARFGGFGLGLAICAAIAKQHGGSITAASAGRGQGATFRLSLPTQGTAAAGRDAVALEPAALHVLYVEDNPDAADAMRYALTRLGWRMTHAPTCARARQLVADSEPFDVVLADLGLPDGSGLELGSELGRHLPVVALTAYGAPLGMQGFASQLMKPADIAEVQRALLRAVTVRRKTARQ